ncbi:hypothetical protein [Arthrobacter sp. R4-81]
MNTKTNKEEKQLDRLIAFGPVLIAIITAAAVAAVVLFIGEMTAMDQALSLTISGSTAVIAGPAFFLTVKKYSR